MKKLWEKIKRSIVYFIADHTPPCKEVTKLVSQSMEEPLSLGKRILLYFHFRICVWCKRYRDQIEFLSKASKTEKHFEIMPPTSSKQKSEFDKSAIQNKLKELADLESQPDKDD